MGIEKVPTVIKENNVQKIPKNPNPSAGKKDVNLTKEIAIKDNVNIRNNKDNINIVNVVNIPQFVSQQKPKPLPKPEPPPKPEPKEAYPIRKDLTIIGAFREATHLIIDALFNKIDKK